MAWELHIQGKSDDDTLVAIGDRALVRDRIDRYFPLTRWNDTIGLHSYQDGLIEFEIEGQPVNVVWLRVHDADPTTDLLNMCGEFNWIVVDHSSGDQLSDGTVRKSISATTNIRAKSKKDRDRGARKSALPKIKKQSAFPAPDEPACPAELYFMVSLNKDEVADDIFNEYSRFVREAGLLDATDSHPMTCNEEIQTKHAVRLGLLYIPAFAQINCLDILHKYCLNTSRFYGRYVQNEIQLSTGDRISVADCTLIRRAFSRQPKDE